MDRAEKVMLVLKSIFHDNEDIVNKIDAIQQLKRPDILLSTEEQTRFDKFAEEWYEKGWIIWNKPKMYEIKINNEEVEE